MDDNTIEQEIQAKGLTAPRITLADIMANIDHIETVKHITQSGQVLRWAVLVTLNGFAVVGKPSVAVSPENDDAEIGEQIAFDNSRNEMWPLMGYALKQRLFETSNTPPAPHSALPPHQQRVMVEAEELATKLSALALFVSGPVFAALDREERDRMAEQMDAMRLYLTALNKRIAAFAPVDSQKE